MADTSWTKGVASASPATAEGNPSGRSIKVTAAVESAGTLSDTPTLIHTVTNDPAKKEVMRITGTNTSSSPQDGTLLFGGSTNPDDAHPFTIPPYTSDYEIIARRTLRGSATPPTIKAYGGIVGKAWTKVSNVLTIAVDSDLVA